MSETAVVTATATRNLLAFWLFGVCNNIPYIIMLAAAQDILSKDDDNTTVIDDVCMEKITERQCNEQSAGIVLLCNILPGLIIKLAYPLLATRLPYGVRHVIVCVLQALSLIITALADSVSLALAGVMLASLASSMGESTYLSLASHYCGKTISTWASGTGMAGVSGAFSYALLTTVIGLSSTQAMLAMLVVPTIFLITYTKLLQKPDTIQPAKLTKPITWISLTPLHSETREEEGSIEKKAVKTMKSMTMKDRAKLAKSLLRYMAPLFAVYFAEYLTNQGLLELIVFDCSHSFGISTQGQYRWYQVLYQVGVFVSRSSSQLVQLNMTFITILPFLQLLNTSFFLIDSVFGFIPHFGVIAVLVLYEGLIGGSSYVHSYNHIHKKVHPSFREIALSIVTLADTAGILAAALTAVPLHNAICSLP